MNAKKWTVCTFGILLILGITVQAAPVCNTIEDCNQLVKAAQTRIAELQNGSLTWHWSKVPRDAKGAIVYMILDDAVKYCASRNMRLPTLREWAQHALSRGATGIRETAYPGVAVNGWRESDDPALNGEITQMRNEQYRVVLRFNESKQIDEVDFYFNGTGYQGELEHYLFWTSSRTKYDTFRFGFYQGDGIFRGPGFAYTSDPKGRPGDEAVVCVTGR